MIAIPPLAIATTGSSHFQGIKWALCVAITPSLRQHMLCIMFMSNFLDKKCEECDAQSAGFIKNEQEASLSLKFTRFMLLKSKCLLSCLHTMREKLQLMRSLGTALDINKKFGGIYLRYYTTGKHSSQRWWHSGCLMCDNSRTLWV